MANMATWWEGLLSLRPRQNETSSLLSLAFSSCTTVFLAVQSRPWLLMLECVLLSFSLFLSTAAECLPNLADSLDKTVVIDVSLEHYTGQVYRSLAIAFNSSDEP
jgi:hypothetical protein